MSVLILAIGMAVSSGAPSSGPMPTSLQWWEKKEITPVAKELAKRKHLKRFYKLLSYHLPKRKACEGMGLFYCAPIISAMRSGIDFFLKKMMLHHKGPVWWEDNSLCWVAAIMLYGDNLKNLYAFIGKQLLKPSATKIDVYFKKIVNAHGGPLIDRNWHKN